MKEKVRVGIIGCGGIAFAKHMPALQALDTAEMVAFYSIPRETAEQAAARFGCREARVYEEIDELLGDPRVDAVHICTPNATHATITIRALEAGKHVLCEKPMATTPEDAQAMVEAARSSGEKLTVGLQNRFRRDVAELKARCANGELGKLYYARAQSTRRRGVPSWGAMLDKELQGGGPLIDIGVHALDLALYFLGDYDVAYVSGSVFHELGGRAGEPNLMGPWEPQRFTVEDSAMAMVHLKSGASVLLEASWALNIPRENEEEIVMGGREARITLCGSEAGAELWHDGYALNGSRDGELYLQKHRFSYAPRYEGAKEEAQAWIGCILEDREPPVTPEQGLTLVRVMDAIYRSGAARGPVYL